MSLNEFYGSSEKESLNKIYGDKRKKARETLIRAVASTFSSQFGFKNKSSGSIEEIVKDLRAHLPISDKLSKSKEVLKKSCVKIAEVFNRYFGQDFINIDAENICQEVSDKLYSLTVQANGEYYDLLANATTLVKNIRSVVDGLNSNYNVFAKDIKNPLARDFHERAIKTLENMADNLQLMITNNSDNDFVEELKNSKQIKKYFEDFDGRNNMALSKIFDTTYTFTNVMKKVEKLAKKLGVSVAEIKKIAKSQDPVKELAGHMESKIKNMNSSDFNEYLKSYDKLREILTDRNLKLVIGKKEFQREVNEEDKKITNLVKLFMDSFNLKIEEMVNCLNLLVKDVMNGKIFINERYLNLLDGDDMVNINNQTWFYQVSGADTSTEAYTERYNFLTKISNMKELFETLDKKNKNVSCLIRICDDLVELVHLFNNKFKVAHGNVKIGYGMGDKIQSGINTAKKYVDVVKESVDKLRQGGLDKINNLRITNFKDKFLEINDDLRLSVKRANLINRLKSDFNSEMEKYKDYDKIEAKNIGNMKNDIIKRFNEEVEKLETDEEKKFHKLMLDAYMDVLSTIEALDIYYHHFFVNLTTNPENIKTILNDITSEIYIENELKNIGDVLSGDNGFNSNNLTSEGFIRNYNLVKDYFENNNGLKSVIAVFSKIGDNFKEGSLFEKTFKYPNQIYEAIIGGVTYFLYLYNNGGGDGGEGGNNDKFMDGLPECYEIESLLSLIIESFLGKIIVAIDVYTIINGNNTTAPSIFPFYPTRMITGGIENIKINENLIEIYLRVPLLIKLYKQLLGKEYNEGNNINGFENIEVDKGKKFKNLGVNLDKRDSFRRLYKLCSKQLLSTNDLLDIISICNNLYDQVKSKQDPCLEVMKIISNDLNMKIGYNFTYNLKFSNALGLANNIDTDFLHRDGDNIEKVPPSEMYTTVGIKHDNKKINIGFTDIRQSVKSIFDKLFHELETFNLENDDRTIYKYMQSIKSNFPRMKEEEKLKYITNILNYDIDNINTDEKIFNYEIKNFPKSLLKNNIAIYNGYNLNNKQEYFRNWNVGTPIPNEFLDIYLDFYNNNGPNATDFAIENFPTEFKKFIGDIVNATTIDRLKFLKKMYPENKKFINYLIDNHFLKVDVKGSRETHHHKRKYIHGRGELDTEVLKKKFGTKYHTAWYDGTDKISYFRQSYTRSKNDYVKMLSDLLRLSNFLGGDAKIAESKITFEDTPFNNLDNIYKSNFRDYAMGKIKIFTPEKVFNVLNDLRSIHKKNPPPFYGDLFVWTNKFTYDDIKKNTFDIQDTEDLDAKGGTVYEFENKSSSEQPKVDPPKVDPPKVNPLENEKKESNIPQIPTNIFESDIPPTGDEFFKSSSTIPTEFGCFGCSNKTSTPGYCNQCTKKLKEEREKEEREKKEKKKLEEGKLEKERLEKERLEKERLEKERLEQERLEKERIEQERLKQEELDRLEKERLEKERLEKEKLEEEAKVKAKLELDRLEKERLEKERLERERLEKERLERERLEKERLEKERLEKEKIEQEKLINNFTNSSKDNPLINKSGNSLIQDGIDNINNNNNNDKNLQYNNSLNLMNNSTDIISFLSALDKVLELNDKQSIDEEKLGALVNKVEVDDKTQSIKNALNSSKLNAEIKGKYIKIIDDKIAKDSEKNRSILSLNAILQLEVSDENIDNFSKHLDKLEGELKQKYMKDLEELKKKLKEKKDFQNKLSNWNSMSDLELKEFYGKNKLLIPEEINNQIINKLNKKKENTVYIKKLKEIVKSDKYKAVSLLIEILRQSNLDLVFNDDINITQDQINYIKPESIVSYKQLEEVYNNIKNDKDFNNSGKIAYLYNTSKKFLSSALNSLTGKEIINEKPKLFSYLAKIGIQQYFNLNEETKIYTFKNVLKTIINKSIISKNMNSSEKEFFEYLNIDINKDDDNQTVVNKIFNALNIEPPLFSSLIKNYDDCPFKFLESIYNYLEDGIPIPYFDFIQDGKFDVLDIDFNFNHKTYTIDTEKTIEKDMWDNIKPSAILLVDKLREDLFLTIPEDINNYISAENPGSIDRHLSLFKTFIKNVLNLIINDYKVDFKNGCFIGINLLVDIIANDDNIKNTLEVINGVITDDLLNIEFDFTKKCPLKSQTAQQIKIKDKIKNLFLEKYKYLDDDIKNLIKSWFDKPGYKLSNQTSGMIMVNLYMKKQDPIDLSPFINKLNNIVSNDITSIINKLNEIKPTIDMNPFIDKLNEIKPNIDMTPFINKLNEIKSGMDMNPFIGVINDLKNTINNMANIDHTVEVVNLIKANEVQRVKDMKKLINVTKNKNFILDKSQIKKFLISYLEKVYPGDNNNKTLIINALANGGNTNNKVDMFEYIYAHNNILNFNISRNQVVTDVSELYNMTVMYQKVFRDTDNDIIRFINDIDNDQNKNTTTNNFFAAVKIIRDGNNTFNAYFTNYKKYNLKTQFNDLFKNYLKRTSEKKSEQLTSSYRFSRVFYSKLIDPIIENNLSYDIYEGKSALLSGDVQNMIRTNVIKYSESKIGERKNIIDNWELLPEYHKSKIRRFLIICLEEILNFNTKVNFFKDVCNYMSYTEIDLLNKMSNILMVIIDCIKNVQNEINDKPIANEPDKNYIKSFVELNKHQPFLPYSSIAPILIRNPENSLFYGARAIFLNKMDKQSFPFIYDTIENYQALKLKTYQTQDLLKIIENTNTLIKYNYTRLLATGFIFNFDNDNFKFFNSDNANTGQPHLYLPKVRSNFSSALVTMRITENSRKNISIQTYLKLHDNNYSNIGEDDKNKLLYLNIFDKNFMPLNLRNLYKSVLFSNVQLLATVCESQLTMLNPNYDFNLIPLIDTDYKSGLQNFIKRYNITYKKKLKGIELLSSNTNKFERNISQRIKNNYKNIYENN